MKSSPLSSVALVSYSKPEYACRWKRRGRGRSALEHQPRAARGVALGIGLDRAREQLVAAQAVAALEPGQARQQPGLAAQLGGLAGGELELRLGLVAAAARLQREAEEEVRRARIPGRARTARSRGGTASSARPSS